MKGFIILAVTVFLVGVQTSSVSTVRKELEDVDESKDVSISVELQWLLEELDGTSVSGALDEVQNIKSIVDVLHFLQNYKDVMGCSGNTCEWCKWSACFKISYLPDSNEFQFCATYRGNNIFCQTVPARDFKYCKKVKVSFLKVEICLQVMNVNISGGKACMDVKVSVAGVSQTFNNICLGTSNHWSLA
ncbi:hypothetical protein CHS0354_038362 [Potamilus streckersoni]|uniref:Uncharacterized protein n=1 Tax=Potamilus streckersoni TaxID=2493646 RepID=A0AAE0S5Z3_9BIVA|nr:hypothetical protein CHS0354_038362 [Potamilus streckersoni]